jgi:hypothetical protein
MAAILWSGVGMVVFGTSIRFLQMSGWRQIDVSAEEIVRRSPGWKCIVLGGVLEEQCNALFAAGRLAGWDVDFPEDATGGSNAGAECPLDSSAGQPAAAYG